MAASSGDCNARRHIAHWADAPWRIVIHRGGGRKTKRIGPDRETAQRVARGLRKKLARGELNLEASSERHTLQNYSKDWLRTVKDSLKAVMSSRRLVLAKSLRCGGLIAANLSRGAERKV